MIMLHGCRWVFTKYKVAHLVKLCTHNSGGIRKSFSGFQLNSELASSFYQSDMVSDSLEQKSGILTNNVIILIAMWCHALIVWSVLVEMGLETLCMTLRRFLLVTHICGSAIGHWSWMPVNLHTVNAISPLNTSSLNSAIFHSWTDNKRSLFKSMSLFSMVFQNIGSTLNSTSSFQDCFKLTGSVLAPSIRGWAQWRHPLQIVLRTTSATAHQNVFSLFLTEVNETS